MPYEVMVDVATAGYINCCWPEAMIVIMSRY